jgi:hypothetical protein
MNGTAITSSGAVSADYSFIVLVGLVGFLVVSICWLVGWYFITTLKQIQVELKQQGKDHIQLRMEVNEMRQTIPDPNEFADVMIDKIRTLNYMKNL